MDPVAHATPPVTGVIRRLETSRESRRVANILSLLLVSFAAVFAAGGALLLLRFPELNIRRVLYLQTAISALVPLWVAYFVYLPAHTVLEFSSVSIRLTRSLPFREWSGAWRDVRRSYYLHTGLFAIRTTARLWPGWTIKVAPNDVLLVDEFRRCLSPGVWLDRRHAKRRLVTRVLVLAHAILLALALLVGVIERVLR